MSVCDSRSLKSALLHEHDGGAAVLICDRFRSGAGREGAARRRTEARSLKFATANGAGWESRQRSQNPRGEGSQKSRKWKVGRRKRGWRKSEDGGQPPLRKASVFAKATNGTRRRAKEIRGSPGQIVLAGCLLQRPQLDRTRV